jgi:hypothetical protein
MDLEALIKRARDAGLYDPGKEFRWEAFLHELFGRSDSVGPRIRSDEGARGADECIAEVRVEVDRMVDAVRGDLSKLLGSYDDPRFWAALDVNNVIKPLAADIATSLPKYHLLLSDVRDAREGRRDRLQYPPLVIQTERGAPVQLILPGPIDAFATAAGRAAPDGWLSDPFDPECLWVLLDPPADSDDPAKRFRAYTPGRRWRHGPSPGPSRRCTGWTMPGATVGVGLCSPQKRHGRSPLTSRTSFSISLVRRSAHFWGGRRRLFHHSSWPG